MSPLCHLLGHLPATDVQHNQGFVFSHCLRCRHDMIRSVDTQRASEWRRVPAGFCVKRGANDRTPVTSASLMPDASAARDLLRIGGLALFWHLRDAVCGTSGRSKPGGRERILRLSVH